MTIATGLSNQEKHWNIPDDFPARGNVIMVELDKSLVAPCGMNCALCSGYLAYALQLPRQRGKVSYCAGCRPRNKQCAFLKKHCPDLMSGRVEYCFECRGYPCDRLKHLDERYRRNYQVSFLENLAQIKERGIDRFLRDQAEKYRCPGCGGVVCVHTGRCPVCAGDSPGQGPSRHSSG